MHSFFTLRKTLFVCVLFLISAVGCTRLTSTELGGGLIPPIDGVITKDTILDVLTDTYDDPDTLRIYKGDNHLVGVINNDPLFGKTTASMYFEMFPTMYPFFISGHKDSIVVDSAVLILNCQGFYGDSTQPITLRVAEIDKTTPLEPLKLYASNYPAQYTINSAGLLAPPKTIDIRRIADSVKNRFENSVYQIRIRLRNDVAQRFIKTYDSTNAYKTDSTLRSFFAGFALTADPGLPTNALLKINLADTNSKFALYYSSSSTGATVRDTAVSYFRFNTLSSGDANFVTRNRSGAQVSNYLAGAAGRSDSLVYVQTAPGTRVRVRIPGLKDLSNRIIHKAELIAEQVPDDANLLTTEQQMTPPRYLLLHIYDSVNQRKRNIPNDYIISQEGPNISSFGGAAIPKSVGGYDRLYTYQFELARYVQGIITRKDTSFTMQITAPVNDSIHYTTPYPQIASQLFYLSPSVGNDPGIGRVRLGGGTHSRFRMRLRVIFSRL